MWRCWTCLCIRALNRCLRLSQSAPLMEMSGVQCFSLQKGDTGPAQAGHV